MSVLRAEVEFHRDRAAAGRWVRTVRARGKLGLVQTAGAIVLLICTACANTQVARARSTHNIRSLLVGGTWARHLDDRRFYPDGTFQSYERGRNYPTHGTWRLEDQELSLTAEHETTRHRILAITPAKLDMTFGAAGQHLFYTRASADQ